MLRSADLECLASLENCEIRADAALAKHTSLGVGGPADALAIPGDRAALSRLLGVCRERGLPTLFLGRGFNLLALDAGVEGVVIALWKLRRIELSGENELYAEAGVSHGSVTRFCVEAGLAGLEFACGIPGTVGGWIAMNAGIPKREMADVLRAVELITPDGERSCSPDEMGFHYRGASLLARDTAIAAGRFCVQPDEASRVRERVDDYLARRAESQPINRPSCGSVFKNPPEDFAGRLIEAAGLKGEQVGGAAISDRHANFIVTQRGASSADVVELIERARSRVFAETGISLVPEVRIVGRGAAAHSGRETA